VSKAYVLTEEHRVRIVGRSPRRTHIFVETDIPRTRAESSVDIVIKGKRTITA